MITFIFWFSSTVAWFYHPWLLPYFSLNLSPKILMWNVLSKLNSLEIFNWYILHAFVIHSTFAKLANRHCLFLCSTLAMFYFLSEWIHVGWMMDFSIKWEYWRSFYHFFCFYAIVGIGSRVQNEIIWEYEWLVNFIWGILMNSTFTSTCKLSSSKLLKLRYFRFIIFFLKKLKIKWLFWTWKLCWIDFWSL